MPTPSAFPSVDEVILVEYLGDTQFFEYLLGDSKLHKKYEDYLRFYCHETLCPNQDMELECHELQFDASDIGFFIYLLDISSPKIHKLIKIAYEKQCKTQYNV